jgi:hypothetical protein
VFLEVLWKGKHTGTLITPFGEFAATFKPYKSRAAMVLEFEGKLIKANLDRLGISRVASSFPLVYRVRESVWPPFNP